jgi:quinol monooxygenase YgiN
MSEPREGEIAMDQPILFISHFRVKPGAVDGLRNMATEVASRMRDEKPRTLSWLAYLDDSGDRISFVHLFADAEAMDLHFEGSDARSRAASGFMEPLGWEIYGAPSEAALREISQMAAMAGVTLRRERDLVAGGFLRMATR